MALIVGAFCVVAAVVQGCGTSFEKPNVVMIVADDQSFRDFGFLGNDRVHTPPRWMAMSSIGARAIRMYR